MQECTHKGILIDCKPAAVLLAGFKADMRGRQEGRQLERRWTISDFAQAYTSRTTTPSDVADRVVRFVEESERAKPPMRFLISFDPKDLRRQAAESTQRQASDR